MKIAIGTLVRDAEKNILKYSKFLKQLSTIFWFDVFVYENDSVDNTKKLLPEISEYYISEDLGVKKFEGSPATFERANFMSQCRNKLKNLIFSKDLYDIVIFTDIDLISWPSVEQIKKNIEKIENNSRIGVITSNGLMLYNNDTIYYDIWSLVIDGKIQNHKIWRSDEIIQYIEVDSAFGGLAIYYGPAIKNIGYQAIELVGFPCPWHPDRRAVCEHCSLNLELRKQNLKVLIDKEMVLYR